MMRLIVPAILWATFVAPAGAETRDLRGFDTVNAEGRFRVEVSVGPDFQVTVDGPDAARIRTRVQGDTLKIDPLHRPWFGNPRYDARITVTVPQLAGVAAARGATVRATGGGECSDFEAAAAMGADLRVDALECETIDAAAAMGGTLRLAGTCGSLDVAAAMGGMVQAVDLRCLTVDASAAMGGDVNAYAMNTYDASASMGGSVNVSGEGRQHDSSTAMGGTIHHRD